MIGWYVDIGYVVSPTSSLPRNLSKITFLDIRRPFTFLFGNVDNLIDNDYATMDELLSMLQTVFQDDQYYIYTIPSLYNDWAHNIVRNYLEIAIPSIPKSYPNSYSVVGANNWGWFAYFPSLKRIMFYLAGSTTGGRIGSVAEDGKISWGASSFLGTLPNYFTVDASYARIMTNLHFLKKYDTPSDILDKNNWGRLSLSCNTSGVYRWYGDGISNWSEDTIRYFFAETTEPDFTITGPTNPYEPGGDSGEGGGGGTFDGDSDQIQDSVLPTLSCADTGFTRLYTPTLSQVQNLARYLWTDESIIDTLWNVVKRYFEDPMQAFISFSIVPVPVPVAGQEEFKVLFIPTGVMLNTVTNQFVDVDCGTFEMKEYYGSALDYSPNTKVSCYLPYIGTVSLNTDDVMGRTLQVKYRVDICSGACVAKILVDGNVIYQFPGCCSVPIPFSSSDFSSYGSAIISAVKTGIAVAAGGAGMTGLGASLVGMDASQHTSDNYTKTTTTTARNPATGRQITTGTEKVTKEYTGTKASLAGIAQTGLSNTANEVTASKTVVERSGSFSGNSGYLGVRRPYLIIERPRMCMPANYQQLNGFPSMITVVLSECKGYTRVQQVQLTGVEATNPEQAEILELLKGGVIL